VSFACSADADCIFICILVDVGSYGRERESAIFCNFAFGKALLKTKRLSYIFRMVNSNCGNVTVHVCL
jgi:hypothetical protein